MPRPLRPMPLDIATVRAAEKDKRAAVAKIDGAAKNMTSSRSDPKGGQALIYALKIIIVINLCLYGLACFLPPASFWHTISPATKAVPKRDAVMKTKEPPGFPRPECVLKNVLGPKTKRSKL